MPTNIQANLILNDSQARETINRLAKDVSSLNLSQPLGRISGDAAEFKKSLEAATARVTAFGLTAGAIYRVSQAIREGAKATIEVDKQLVELNTFLGQSTKQLEGFSQSLFKIAKNSAVPFEAASEAAKEFARQGLSANEILKRTESALTLARISGISYAQAVNGVTTALNSFSKEALQAEDIVNKLIAVDTRFAVSSAQLNEALTRVGSSAEESGISIDKLIATVTAAQQTTGRGGAVIGNALKTIFTRLQRPEVLNQLEQLGVAVKDQNGFLLDGIGILKNYADATKNLSQIEKARTAELIGGIYQINQVNALIKDLSNSNSVYADALRTSSEATDEAKKKNEELNKSLSAVLQKTKTSAQEAAAALGSSLLDPIVKLGSAAAETLLKFVNPNSDMLTKGENSGKEIGAAIAKGVGSSLGRSLVVGGAPLLAATGGLLAVKMLKFGVSSVKELGKASGEIFASEKEVAIQKRINDTLRQSPSIIEDVRKRKIDLAGAEREVLRLIDEQNRSLLTQARITGRVTSTVASAQKASKKGFKIFADGYVPEMNLEESQAISMGAVNPKAKVIQATIGGRSGPVIVNSEEKIIPNYAGTGETAIIPNYRNFDDIPRTAATGYVPNFANPDREILRKIININRQNMSTDRFANPQKYGMKTPLYRGVNATSERWRSVDRNDPEAVNKAVFSQVDYAKLIPGYNPKKAFMGSYFEDLASSHRITPLGGRDIFDEMHRNTRMFGYSRSLPFTSTSKDPSIAYQFAGNSGASSSTIINNSRILGNESLYKDLYEKYGEDEVREVMFRQSKAGGGRGLGLDFNSLGKNPAFNYEHEVGLFSKGYVPNFAKKDKYKFPKISSEKMEANISRNFEKLSPGDQKYFARAYEDYNNLIKVFSKASGTSPEKFANVMSALSPANPLERNALDALRYNLYAQKKLSTIASPIFLDEREIGSVKAQTYGANRTKAANLIVGLEKLTGNKRKAFLNNMLDPFKSQDVTVDYRAQGDALGKTFNVKNAPTMNREQYDKVSQAFRSVGARAGVSGLGVQAATWIGQRMGTKAAKGQDFNRGILKFFYDNPDKISLENLESLLSVPAKGKARKDFFKKASSMGVSKLGPDSLISIPRMASGYVPNFALSGGLAKLASRLGFGKNRSTFSNPISAGIELFQGNLITGLIDQLAEAEKVPTEVSTAANVATPAYYGLKNIGQGIFGKGSKAQRVLSGASGLAQLAYGGATAFAGGDDLKNRISERKYAEALDASRQKFQDLTENTTELSNTLSKLDAAYRDPRADPTQISKLAKTREDLLSKVSQKNPELVSKLASESSITGKISILEENSREAQRIQSVKEQALKFSTKGITSGKEAPTQITDFFRSVINAGNKDLLKQDLSKATPANFADILKKGGLDVQELSNAFKTDDLKKSFIDALKLTQNLNEITSKQERELARISKPQIRAQQMAADSKEVRDEIRKSLEEQLPELASFAGTFSKRAGISASSEASLAIKKGQASVSFQNSLLSQLSDKEFTKGLPSQVQARLLGIESPGMAAGKELEAIKQLPGLSQLQVDGIEKLIGFNSEQTRSIKKAETIANESKNIQLRFLALQEKLAFGGDIRSSINPQLRNESMAASIRGPLTYQLGGMLGSRRTQIGGATDFITETMQKYPGLLQTKDGKEPGDIKALKAELTGLNAMDMQRDLLKRASMASMMGMGQTAGLLRGKAFDPKYLFESAGLKASALFGGPEVPKEVQDAIGGYEKFGVQSARQSKAESTAVKAAEDAVVSLKQSVTDIATAQSQALVSAFESGLKSTFGEKGIIASVVNLTTSAVNSKGSQGETPNVPNFANPVNDAVTREKMALAKRGIMGIPNFAMASINLERSPDLVSASNPHGFGVTNSIDEKNGLRSLGMRSSGYVPNYALFGDKVASAGLSAAKAGNLFVYDHDAQGFYRVTASGRVGSEFIDKNSLPKGAKTISTQPYSTKYGSGQSRGSNILKITDPRLSKLDELNVSSIPRSKRLDPILNKLSKSGKLTPENLLSAINKISGGEPTLVKTAFGSSFAQGKGVFGRSGGVGLDDADEIIKRFQSGDSKGFFAQAKVDGPHYGEMRVHVAVDSNGRVKLLKGGSLLKIGGNASDITSKEGVAALAKAGLSKEASKVAREYKKAAESTAVKSIRELVAKKGIKNTFFGVDVGATTLESAQRAGVNSKEFYSGGRGRVGTVVFELNPSEAAGSSGYVRGGISQKLVDQTLGKQLGVMPPGFAPKGSSITKKIADAFTASAASQIAQQSPSYSYMPGANQVASASTSSGSSSYSYMPKQLNRIPEGFKFKSQEAINKILGQELSKSKPLSMGGYGPAIGSQGSVSGVVTNSIPEKYGPKAFKFLSKYGGKALGALGGATSIYGYYEGFQEAKRDKYAGAAKMFESTGGLALAGAGLAGAGLATTLALPLAVGALGYGAIKGVESTGLLDAMYGAGYGTLGLSAIGSKSIRGMTSRTAFNDDMIVARKKELLKETNKYNAIAGNPLVSEEFQLSRSRAVQEKKDEQDLQQLKDRLDKESEATRAAIYSKAAGVGIAETARLNKESVSAEEARSSSLRKSFLESFSQNAESAGYLTTRDKVNYLLDQEKANGMGQFQPSDFGSDVDLFRSFVNYKKEREKVPNFAAMSNSMMSSNEVYSRMRSAASPSAMTGYAGGHVPNFAAGDFTNAVTEALKNGITSAFPNGGSSSNVSNSNVINIDGRTSIQNAPDEAMQGIISILFDKIPELKKLGPAALNFKR